PAPFPRHLPESSQRRSKRNSEVLNQEAPGFCLQGLEWKVPQRSVRYDQEILLAPKGRGGRPQYQVIYSRCKLGVVGSPILESCPNPLDKLSKALAAGGDRKHLQVGDAARTGTGGEHEQIRYVV